MLGQLFVLMLWSQAFWLQIALAVQHATVCGCKKPLHCVTHREKNAKEPLLPFRSQDKDCKFQKI